MALRPTQLTNAPASFLLMSNGTAGLYDSLSHPEITVVGLAVPVMHQIVNAVGEQVRNLGFQVERFGR